MTENQGEVRTKRIRKADISTRSWQRHIHLISTSVEVDMKQYTWVSQAGDKRKASRSLRICAPGNHTSPSRSKPMLPRQA